MKELLLTVKWRVRFLSYRDVTDSGISLDSY